MNFFKRLIVGLNRRIVAAQAAFIVKAVYQGLLKRNPDSEGLQAYVRALRERSDVSSLIKDIAQSDEHWDLLMAARSAGLAQKFAQAFSAKLTGLAPTQEHLEAWARSLQDPRATDALADTTLQPRDLLKRVGDHHANAWADSLYQGLLARPANESERQQFNQALRDEQLSQLIQGLLAGRELHLHLHARISSAIAETAYRLGGGIEPDAPALERVLAQYALEDSPQRNLIRIYEQARQDAGLTKIDASAFVRSIYALCVKNNNAQTELNEHIQAALLPQPNWQTNFIQWLGRQMNLNRPAVLNLAHSSTQLNPSSIEGIELLDGWYPWEDGFAWGQTVTRLRVTQPKMIWISFANFRLMATSAYQPIKVTFTLGAQSHTIIEPDPSLAYGIFMGMDQGEELLVRVNLSESMQIRNLVADRRKLHQHITANQIPWGKKRGPLIFSEHLLVGVYSNQKDRQAIEPLIPRLRSKGLQVMLLGHTQLPTFLNSTAYCEINWVIAAAETYTFLERAGATGQVIYLEHGIAPLKKHTYEAHYLRNDLNLLCSSLWTERLHQLYGSDVNAHSVGFAKLRQPARLSKTKRAQRLRQMNLKANQPVILFAPSWSAGLRHAGIFNVQHISSTFNMLTVPHEGDFPFIADLSKKFNIHKQAPGETINDYYAIADIVISDISSTAIEAACLGKPVICMIPDGALPDVDPSVRESATRLRIPHTERYWDFCEVATPSEINEAISRLLESLPAADSITHAELEEGQVPNHLKPWIDCYGDAAIEKTCQAIQSFLHKTQNSSDAIYSTTVKRDK